MSPAHGPTPGRAALPEIVAAALNMQERRLLAEALSSFAETASPAIDARIARWRYTAAQDDELRFARRLEWDGLDLPHARRVLAAVSPPDVLPSWAVTIEAIIETCREWTHAPAARQPDDPPQPFQEIVAPIVVCARRRLMAHWAAHRVEQGASVSPAAFMRLESALCSQLSFIATPALFGEFGKEQQPGVLLLHRFGVPSAQPPGRDRYQAFVARMLNDGLLSLFISYPVLARLLAVAVDSWVETTALFLDRLEQDYSALESVFSHPHCRGPLGEVVDIDPALSDPHNGGHTVMRVSFRNGARILYKPKDLGLEEAWRGFLRWCNEHGAPLDLQHPAVLTRQGWGWVEHVDSAGDCQAPECFYRRAGAMLFYVFLLSGTDCHAENLIACGDRPVLVDLETLFHPTAHPVGPDMGMFDSVLRTGLLPRWECEAGTRRLADLSGLGQRPAQPQYKRQWRLVNTDEMYPVWETVPASGAHVPVTGGVRHAPEQFLDDLLLGFEETYRFAMRHRQVLASASGPLAAFRSQVGRFIFRPTRIYFEIFEQSLAGEFLRDGAERTIELERLAFAYLSTPERPRGWPILRAELDAMEKMDIPHFTCLSDGQTLLAAGQRIESYLRTSGFERMMTRLGDLAEGELVLQSELIRGTFLALADGAHLREDPTLSAAPAGTQSDVDLLNRRPGLKIPAGELLRLAREIGDELARRSVLAGASRRSWLGLTFVQNTEQFQVNLLTANLYDGVCGVAVFLAALDQAIGRSDFAGLVREVLAPIRQTIAGPPEGARRMIRRLGIGGALGFGSIIYALVRIGRCSNHAGLLGDALQAASALDDDDILSSARFDVVDGVAGCLLALAALYRATSATRALRLAEICGERLLSAQLRRGPNRGGLPSDDGGMPMTGFSHGASGIACSLSRLYEISGDVRFRNAAREAFSSERPVLAAKPAAGAHHTSEGEREPLVSWCHGAAGMALARLDALSTDRCDELQQEAETAVGITESYGLRTLDSLCCGNLGRMETLLAAASTSRGNRFERLAESWTASVVARSREFGSYRLRSNSHTGKILFNPPLFHGMAGVGYQLLRAARPADVPSLLLWR